MCINETAACMGNKLAFLTHRLIYVIYTIYLKHKNYVAQTNLAFMSHNTAVHHGSLARK